MKIRTLLKTLILGKGIHFIYQSKVKKKISVKSSILYQSYNRNYKKEYFRKEHPTYNQLHLNQSDKRSLHQYVPPKYLSNQLNILPSSHYDQTYMALRKDSDKVIFYIHGGTFFNHPSIKEFAYIRKLADATNASVYMPIYPIGPHYHHSDTNHFLFDVYTKIYNDISYNNLVVLGHECGANLALNILQRAKLDGYKPVKEIILECPLINLDLSDESYQYLDNQDPILDLNTLKKEISYYSYDLQTDNLHINPYYRSCDIGSKLTLISPTQSILYENALSFKAKALEEEVHVDFYPYHNLYHNFMFDNTKESEEYLALLKSIIHRDRISVYKLKTSKHTSITQELKRKDQ